LKIMLQLFIKRGESISNNELTPYRNHSLFI
jgi:hypothetical protein